jgi:hypothetical protein
MELPWSGGKARFRDVGKVDRRVRCTVSWGCRPDMGIRDVSATLGKKRHASRAPRGSPAERWQRVRPTSPGALPGSVQKCQAGCSLGAGADSLVRLVAEDKGNVAQPLQHWPQVCWRRVGEPGVGQIVTGGIELKVSEMRELEQQALGIASRGNASLVPDSMSSPSKRPPRLWACRTTAWTARGPRLKDHRRQLPMSQAPRFGWVAPTSGVVSNQMTTVLRKPVHNLIAPASHPCGNDLVPLVSGWKVDQPRRDTPGAIDDEAVAIPQ